MSQQDGKANNEKESGVIDTISSGKVLPNSSEGGVITDQSAIPTINGDNGTTKEGEETNENVEEEEEDKPPGCCDDPCHNFHFLCCAVFPPYMFVWMAICLKQEGEEILDEEEEKRIREQERAEYFEWKKKEREEKQRKKEEKKAAKEAKKQAKKEAKEAAKA